MQCDDCQMNLDDFRRGCLPPETADEVAAHLASCSECSRALDEVEQIRNLLRTAAEDTEMPSEEYFISVRETVAGRAKVRSVSFLRQRTVRRLAELAAVFIVGAVAVFFAFQPGGRRDRAALPAPSAAPEKAKASRAIALAAEGVPRMSADRELSEPKNPSRELRAKSDRPALATALESYALDESKGFKAASAESSGEQPKQMGVAKSEDIRSAAAMRPSGAPGPVGDLRTLGGIETPASEVRGRELALAASAPAVMGSEMAKATHTGQEEPNVNADKDRVPARSEMQFDKMASSLSDRGAAKSAGSVVAGAKSGPATNIPSETAEDDFDQQSAMGLSSGQDVATARLSKTGSVSSRREISRKALSIQYDATDGTVSHGDVWRVRQNEPGAPPAAGLPFAPAAAGKISSGMPVQSGVRSPELASESELPAAPESFGSQQAVSTNRTMMAQAAPTPTPALSTGGEGVGFFSTQKAPASVSKAGPVTDRSMLAAPLPQSPHAFGQAAAGADQRQVMLPQDQLFYNGSGRYAPASPGATGGSTTGTEQAGRNSQELRRAGGDSSAHLDELRRVAEASPGTAAAAHALVQLGDIAYEQLRDYTRAREAYLACIEPSNERHLTTQTLQRVRERLDEMSTITLP